MDLTGSIDEKWMPSRLTGPTAFHFLTQVNESALLQALLLPHQKQTNNMKAAVFQHYGSPDVLKIRDIQKPTPKDQEILVRIHATAVNSGDVRLRKADPFAVRFMLGLFRPRIKVLGGVFSGQVEAVGKHVTKYKVGDEVFGSTDFKFGAYAEYKCFPEDAAMAIKPGALSHAEAAVIPFGGATALYFLKKANIVKGQKILIYGASGAVGTAAVQLARYFGADVTAVSGPSNLERVKSLGAHKVIDYTQKSWTEELGQYDVIYDTVNKLPLSLGFSRLKSKGTMILGAAAMPEMMAGLWKSLFGSAKVRMGVTKQDAGDINFLAERVKEGKLQPVIDRSYPLEQIAAAHAYVDQGHKQGNVAIML